MEVKIRHLHQVNTTYYFRRKVPLDLQPKIDKKVLKISLRTSDLHKAALFCNLYNYRTEYFFRTARRPNMDKEQIKKLTEGMFKTPEVPEPEKLPIDYRIGKHDSWEEYSYNFEKLRYEDAVKDFEKEMVFWLKQAEIKIQREDLDIAIGSEEHEFLAREMAKRHLESVKNDVETAKRHYEESLSHSPSPAFEQAKHLIKPGTQPVPHTHPVNERYSLQLLIQRYLTDKKNGETWGDKMAESTEKVLDFVLEVFGDVDIRSLNHVKLLDFRDNILRKLPANMEKVKRYRGKNYQEVLQMDNVEPQSIKTVNTKLTKMHGFFKWCSTHDFTDKDIASGLRIATKIKPYEERQVYTSEELEKIITEIPKVNAYKPWKLWVTLVAMCNGMRQSEIGQLVLDDIVVEGDIPCFSNIKTSEEDGKSIKTISGYRIIPIHPVLLELGFMDYVESIRGRRSKSLWPELKSGARDGMGQRIQRWFNNFNRKYITDDKRKSFHSFRHCFVDNLINNGADSFVVECIDGHSSRRRSETLDRYAKPARPARMLEEMQKLDYGIDIVALAKSGLSGNP